MLTGYAKADGLWTNTSDGELAENSASRDFYVPGATPIEGGLPIVVGGKMIGAVGVSGVTSPQDGVVAKAGADALK